MPRPRAKVAHLIKLPDKLFDLLLPNGFLAFLVFLLLLVLFLLLLLGFLILTLLLFGFCFLWLLRLFWRAFCNFPPCCDVCRYMSGTKQQKMSQSNAISVVTRTWIWITSDSSSLLKHFDISKSSRGAGPMPL